MGRAVKGDPQIDKDYIERLPLGREVLMAFDANSTNKDTRDNLAKGPCREGLGFLEFLRDFVTRRGPVIEANLKEQMMIRDEQSEWYRRARAMWTARHNAGKSGFNTPWDSLSDDEKSEWVADFIEGAKTP